MPPSAAANRERTRNLLFFTRPPLWPAWPFLPLMRRRPNREEECGLPYDALHASGKAGHSATVFACNLFRVPPTEKEFLALPKEVHDSAEEIYESAWRVD